jgi:lysophospholipase L1-like esterase
MRALFLALVVMLSAATQRSFAGLPSNLQIFPLGDSITYGYPGSNGGYRGQLYTLLAPIATNFLFVGSSTQNWGITTLPVAEQHNEGHPSYACDNIYTNLDGLDESIFHLYGGAARDPNGGNWLTGITSGTNARPALFPNVTLLLIGANERDNTNGAQSRLDSLVAKLIILRPTNQLIVARITPITDSIAHSNFVNSYNQGVDAVVLKYAVSNLVTKVDLNTGFPPGGLSSDNLHPNDTGYNWMAGQWYAAILAVYNQTNLANGIYKVINRNSGLALDAKGQNTTNGTPIQQYTYNGGANQHWAVTNIGNAQYAITGVQSGRVLDVKGQSTANGAVIQLYNNNGGANQKWVITPTSGGYATVQGVQSGKLMEVVGGQTTNSAPVDQWTSNGGNNQQWSFQAP